MESLFQLLEIGGYHGRQTAGGQELRGVLRLLHGDRHHARLTPACRCHSPGRGQAVEALGIEEEEEDSAAFDRVRLARHGDLIGRARAGLAHLGHPKGNQREHHHDAHDWGRATQPGRRPGPQSGNRRQQQHEAVADEEARSHHALDPREATAIGAAQGAVLGREVDHENHQQRPREGGAPAPEPRRQYQGAGHGLHDPEEQRGRQAERFRHFGLGHAQRSALRIGDFPDSRRQEQGG